MALNMRYEYEYTIMHPIKEKAKDVSKGCEVAGPKYGRFNERKVPRQR